MLKLWDSPLNIDNSPVNPYQWPVIYTLKLVNGVVVKFYRTENGGIRMSAYFVDFEPIDFKPFQLNIAGVTACFLIPTSNPQNYTLSVSRPGDFNELIKLTVASPGDFHETSSPAAPAKPKKPRNKGSTSGGHRSRNQTAGPSTTTTD